MKIIYISSDNNKTSGAFLCLVELNRYILQNTDIETMIILPKKGDGIELLEKYNIPYKYIPSFSWVTYKGISIKAVAKTIFKFLMLIYNLYAVFSVCKIIKREKADIIHTNTILSYVGAVAAWIEGVPHIWHIREDICKSFNSRIIIGDFGYELMKKSCNIISVSNVIKKRYELKLLPSNISVVYDGVPERFYKKRNIFNDSKVTFTCIGALVNNKNQEELIKACYELKKRGVNNFYLKLVGRGPNYSKLKCLVKNLDLSTEVEFCGIYNDITRVLTDTDVICTTSLSEAFGRTTIEGMLCGCLAIGAKNIHSATYELIENGITGFLYESGDINELYMLMRHCCDSERQDELRRVAECGQKEAKTKYITKANADKIISIYEEIWLSKK